MAKRSDPPAVPEGVAFPEVDGVRSTSATGRAVLAAAARAADPALAERIETEDRWHRGYARHLWDLTAAELRDPAGAEGVAVAGLAALQERFVFARDGAERPLTDVATLEPTEQLHTVTVSGGGRPGQLTVPYRGQQLTGDALHRQLDTWVDAHIVEPSFAEAIRSVVANPDWLDLSDRTVVVLGAGAELGPFGALCRWGATVAPVDLPRPGLWRRLLATIRDGAGRGLIPVRGPADTGEVDAIAEVAGADLTAALPEVIAWVRGLDGPLVIGTYAYAHGADHVRVNLAADVLQERVAADRDGVTLAGLLTPTDVFGVPEPVVATARELLRTAPRGRRVARHLTAGRAFAPHHRATIDGPEGSVLGIADALVLQQGPNYALAKRLQRWRFQAARAAGVSVSANVAPATSTRSVVSNRILAAAYAGAPRFGVEVFAPETANTLMAALLVRDLRDPAAPGNPATVLAHPQLLFSDGAAHGGLWSSPFLPRTVLPTAALLGLPRVLRSASG